MVLCYETVSVLLYCVVQFSVCKALGQHLLQLILYGFLWDFLTSAVCKVHRAELSSSAVARSHKTMWTTRLVPSRSDSWWSSDGSVLKPWESQAGKLSWKDLSVFSNALVGFLKALSSTWFCAKDFLWVHNSLKCMISSSHNLHRLCQPGFWEAPHVALQHVWLLGHLSPDMVQKGWAPHCYPTEKALFCSLPSLADRETWCLCLGRICSGFPFRKGKSMSFSFFSFSVLK